MAKVLLKRGHVFRDDKGRDIATLMVDITKGMAAKHKHYRMTATGKPPSAEHPLPMRLKRAVGRDYLAAAQDA